MSTARQPLSANPTGTNLARFVKCLVLAKGNPIVAEQFAETRYRDSPAVAMTLKAIVEAGDTTTSGWGAQLATYGVGQELLSFVNGISVFSRLQPFMQPLPFRVPTPVLSTAPSAAWVGESLPKPISTASMASANVTMEFYKLVVIVVLSETLARMSSPAAETALRNVLVNAIAKTRDSQFLDPTVSLIAQTRPASVTNGATEIPSTGSTAALIQADLISMTAALGTWRHPYWVMQPKTASNIAAKLGPAVTNGGPMTLLDIPVIKSIHSPAQITLLDAAAITYAADPIELGSSNQTTIEMETTPAIGEQSPPSTQSVLKSMYQNNLIGLKAEEGLSYARANDSSVVFMQVSY